MVCKLLLCNLLDICPLLFLPTFMHQGILFHPNVCSGLLDSCYVPIASKCNHPTPCVKKPAQDSHTCTEEDTALEAYFLVSVGYSNLNFNEVQKRRLRYIPKCPHNGKPGMATWVVPPEGQTLEAQCNGIIAHTGTSFWSISCSPTIPGGQGPYLLIYHQIYNVWHYSRHIVGT